MKLSKKMKVVLTISLVAILAIGGTFAYLSMTTTPISNVFTFQSNITATLSEPSWTDGVDADENGIPDAAEKMTPGSEVAKDPQITNTSAIDVYAAIKVTFQKGNGTTLTSGDMATLMTLIDIQYQDAPTTYASGYNTTNWALSTSSTAGAPVQTWYYKAALNTTTGTVTTPLFNKIVIKEDVTSGQIDWLNSLGGFKINVVGAAVQADVFTDAAAASTGLYNLLTP